MNLPLNIDWQQILLHMLNFVLLAGGLYFLLYKPVKSFMDKRTGLYRSMDEQANVKLSEAEKLHEDYEKRLLDAQDEIEDKKNEACAEAAKVGALEIEKAKKQADKIIADAHKAAERERNKIIAEAQNEVADLATKATEKLLSEKSGVSLFEQFLTAAERSGQNE